MHPNAKVRKAGIQNVCAVTWRIHPPLDVLCRSRKAPSNVLTNTPRTSPREITRCSYSIADRGPRTRVIMFLKLSFVHALGVTTCRRLQSCACRQWRKTIGGALNIGKPKHFCFVSECIKCAGARRSGWRNRRGRGSWSDGGRRRGRCNCRGCRCNCRGCRSDCYLRTTSRKTTLERFAPNGAHQTRVKDDLDPPLRATYVARIPEGFTSKV